jgi:long-chain acyl-CoA synthetase
LSARLAGTPLKIVDLTQLPPAPEGLAPPKFPAPAANDMAVLMYTSGTSGLPKGVILTYNNLQSDVDAAIAHAGLKHEHRFLGVIPLFHAFGMTAMMLAPIQLGATVVYLARFNPLAALEAIRTHAISLMFGVPSMYAAIAHLKNTAIDDFKSIYAIISGGEPLSPALRELFMQRFGVRIYEGFGLTETSPVIALNVPQSFREGSVGKLVPGAEARIVDDHRKPLPAGETGDIWLRGPMVMKGYYNLPDATAEALTPDGFFKTGDLGKLDEDGFLYITGRRKEMIIIAGEKAYPREIEDVLMRHPDVTEAAVIGRKDPSRGEVVVAFVIPRAGARIEPSALRDFCRAQGLAQWKCPREVNVVEDLPRSPTGKVLKRVLAEQLNGA